MAKAFTVPFLFTVLFLGIVGALDESQYYELPCDQLFPKVDQQWMMSVKTWYIPLWSRLDWIRVATGFLNKPVAELTDADLGQDTCATFQLDGNVSGFGATGTLIAEPMENGMKFTFGNYSGEMYFQLTDNKSFILMTCCWEDGQTSWAAMTTEMKLDKPTEKRITSHIKSLGFKKQLIKWENYDNCGLSAGDTKGEL